MSLKSISYLQISAAIALVAALLLPQTAKADIYSEGCSFYVPSLYGKIRINQKFDAQRNAEKYDIEYDMGEFSENSDGSFYKIKTFQYGQGSFVRDYNADSFGQMIAEIRIYRKTPLAAPAMLMFSRENYINIDLGLGKIYSAQPDQIDGTLMALEGADRLLNYADGSEYLMWSLYTVEDSNDAFEFGRVDMAPLNELKKNLLAFSDERKGMSAPYEGCRV